MHAFRVCRFRLHNLGNKRCVDPRTYASFKKTCLKDHIRSFEDKELETSNLKCESISVYIIIREEGMHTY